MFLGTQPIESSCYEVGRIPTPKGNEEKRVGRRGGWKNEGRRVVDDGSP